ncbi:metallophosphoesterase family protein [Helicovermis profundi]|uniref:Calcineurin-like phosphoesterase domain-containing protein n=1 Tax=Helicovermis profundi TaxID=3065157 RepID=A0AAU9EQC7_9FIRM|nr:hypothetical protein HLPR_19020 [Clostridia bacterium S502]
MKKKIIVFLSLIFFVFLSFIYFGYNNFKIDESFKEIPLNFNPYNLNSEYNFNGITVKIHGGFVKGTIKDKKGNTNIILRALSPNPVVSVSKSEKYTNKTYLIIENINSLKVDILSERNFLKSIIDTNNVQFVIDLNKYTSQIIKIVPKKTDENSEIVILGDNRNGYDTFLKMIDQINAINPLFVIDNGDLVYGGEPNKYRLFYETILNFKVPLYTTLGNHDIRENGRKIYTKLFGPPYYSFDYGDIHFVFLDSSRGWENKEAIPKDQYKWLEYDLKKAFGKRIFVVSHIPPIDPRSNVEDIGDNELKDKNFIKNIINDYSSAKNFAHGFHDKKEALKFENLMSKYKVDTVFLSHIHSYFNYVKGDVRYIISGGAGAELLTKNSYYHFLKIKINTQDKFIEMIELPSPPNNIIDRYIAVINLFSKALYKEYKIWIVSFEILVNTLIIFFIYINRQIIITYIKISIKFIKKIFVYSVQEFKNMRKK